MFTYSLYNGAGQATATTSFHGSCTLVFLVGQAEPKGRLHSVRCSIGISLRRDLKVALIAWFDRLRLNFTGSRVLAKRGILTVDLPSFPEFRAAVFVRLMSLFAARFKLCKLSFVGL